MSNLSRIPRGVFRYDILPGLNDEQIKNILKTSPTLEEYADEHESDELFWKRKVEVEFNKGIPLNNHRTLLTEQEELDFAPVFSWQDVYTNLYHNKLISGKPNTPWKILLYPGNDIAEYIDLAIDQGVKPNINNNAAMYSAIDNNNIKVLNRLLEDPAIDPSYQNNKPLFTASRNGFSRIVERLLMDSRVDPTVGENVTISVAYFNNFPDVVAILLNDNRVRNSLDPEVLKEYESLIPGG